MLLCEIEMMNEVISEKHPGGPYPFCTHIIQQPDGLWILDNGIH